MLVEACIIGMRWNRNVTTKVEELQQKHVEKPKELRKLIETRIAVARNMHWIQTSEQKSCCKKNLKMTKLERREKLLEKKMKMTEQEQGEKLQKKKKK